jgi:hypothetical protein
MKAIEFTSNLKNKTITVPEDISNDLIEGKKVRVILLLDENNSIETFPIHEYKAAGSLNQFSSIDKVAEEKIAWEKHVRDKYENR